MANVNPPPLRIPKAVLADPETAGFFLELLTVIRQLWIRTGGSSSDTINNVTNFTAQTTIGGMSFEHRADEIERRIAGLFGQLMTAQNPIMSPSPVAQISNSIHQALPPAGSDALKLAVVKYGAA